MKFAGIIHPALKVIEERSDAYAAQFSDLTFLVSYWIEDNGRKWLHASVSRRDDKLPTYDNLMKLKHFCIGDHRTALQVFPPQDKHINWAGKRGIEVLHLWSSLDGDVTPDFTRGLSCI